MSRVTPTSSRPRGGRRALSLAEVMISLAITAMLLSAIAAAFQSSAAVVQANDEFFRATQSARVALNQILTEVRRCDTIDDRDTVGISTTRIPIMRPAETRPVNEKLRIYEYDATNRRIVLYFQYADDSLSPKYTLAEGIESAPFDWIPGTDANGSECVARVSVSLNVRVGGNRIRLSGAAAPRRSAVFE